MALILNIDTSIDTAYISIAKDGTVLSEVINEHQKNNASILHVSIKNMLQQLNIDIAQLDAIAVTIGPGSYTGLRVGLSAAKGLCYALNKPLITIGTLLLMATHAIEKTENETEFLFCPMIDARRMEVFTGVYNHALEEVMHTQALVLDSQSFSEILADKKIIFLGNGMPKWKNINNNTNAYYLEVGSFYRSMNTTSLAYFQKEQFADLAYVEPLYVKEFYNL